MPYENDEEEDEGDGDIRVTYAAAERSDPSRTPDGGYDVRLRLLGRLQGVGTSQYPPDVAQQTPHLGGGGKTRARLARTESATVREGEEGCIEGRGEEEKRS